MQVEFVKSKKDVVLAHPLILDSFKSGSRKAQIQNTYEEYIAGRIKLSRYRRIVKRNLFLEGITFDTPSTIKYLETKVRHGRYMEINKEEE